MEWYSLTKKCPWNLLRVIFFTTLKAQYNPFEKGIQDIKD